MSTFISRQDLYDKLTGGKPPVLVEALGAAYFADAHLHGAVNIPPDQVDRLAPRLLPDLDVDIVVYGSGSCQNSTVTAQRLTELGYQHVVVYDGGKEDWIEHGLAVERDGDTS